MPDIPADKRSSPVRIVGGGADDESNLVNVSDLKELSNADILNNGGADTELTIGTIAVELKVGGSRKTDRKLIIIMPLDKGFKIGFSSSTQNIPLYKRQVVILHVGDQTGVWAKNANANKKIAVGEL